MTNEELDALIDASLEAGQPLYWQRREDASQCVDNDGNVRVATARSSYSSSNEYRWTPDMDEDGNP